MTWQFWVDRGGTFTDVVARHADGRILTAMLLSDDSERYADAAVEAERVDGIDVLGSTDRVGDGVFVIEASGGGSGAPA